MKKSQNQQGKTKQEPFYKSLKSGEKSQILPPIDKKEIKTIPSLSNSPNKHSSLYKVASINNYQEIDSVLRSFGVDFTSQDYMLPLEPFNDRR
jgi:hypothetical protein